MKKQLLAQQMDFFRRFAGSSRFKKIWNAEISSEIKVKSHIIDKIQEKQLV